MADKTNTNIANGIISGLTLICGIVLCVLISLLIQRLLDIVTLSISPGSSSSFDTASYAAYAGSPYWSIGFAYIVPGLIGVIASLVRQKCGYILQMVFAIITCVVMGILFILALLVLSALSIYSFPQCSELAGSCVCDNGYRANINFGSSCSDINSLSSIGIGATAMIVIGWIAALAACITGGMLACARDDTPGMVIHNTQPTVSVMHMGHMQPAQPYVVQPGYGYSPQAQPGYPSPGYGDTNVGYDNSGYNYKR